MLNPDFLKNKDIITLIILLKQKIIYIIYIYLLFFIHIKTIYQQFIFNQKIVNFNYI